MLDYLKDIGTMIADFFNLTQGFIDSVDGFLETVDAWWDALYAVVTMFPLSVVAIVIAGFALLRVFIGFDIVRDFL